MKSGPRGIRDNLWSRLKTAEVELALRRCICVEKEQYERLSDYEKFSAYLSCRYGCVGNVGEEAFRNRWRALLGDALPLPSLFLSEEAKGLLWRQGNLLFGSTASEAWERLSDEGTETVTFCDEKQHFEKMLTSCVKNDEFYHLSLRPLDVYKWLRENKEKRQDSLYQTLRTLVLSENILLFADCSEHPFERPNPYRAELAWGTANKVEKYNSKEKGVLLYQIIVTVLQLIARENLQSKVLVSFGGETVSALAFLDYLAMRRLEKGLLLAVDAETEVHCLSEHPLCDGSRDISFALWERGQPEAERLAQIAGSAGGAVPFLALTRNAVLLQNVMKNTISEQCLSALLSAWRREISE